MGTVTEIHDYLRLLFARIGVPYSPATGLPIESQTVSQMVDRILAMPEGTRLYLLAPVIRGRKGEYRKELAELLKRGFTRVKIDGEIHDMDAAPALDKKRKHDIEVVVDRVVVSPSLGTRLADSLETGLGLTDGLVVAEDAESGERSIFSAKFACPSRASPSRRSSPGSSLSQTRSAPARAATASASASISTPTSWCRTIASA